MFLYQVLEEVFFTTKDGLKIQVRIAIYMQYLRMGILADLALGLFRS